PNHLAAARAHLHAHPDLGRAHVHAVRQRAIKAGDNEHHRQQAEESSKPRKKAPDFQIRQIVLCALRHGRSGREARSPCRYTSEDVTSYLTSCILDPWGFQKMKWQLQDAKARFSELIEDSLQKGPQ